jgi:hypothetical protein
VLREQERGAAPDVHGLEDAVAPEHPEVVAPEERLVGTDEADRTVRTGHDKKAIRHGRHPSCAKDSSLRVLHLSVRLTDIPTRR